mmetsp:Transcript_9534/g.23480  ORF Transcript_9534/g.23480 Transcript_9534/m.23480 type:complete len:238 (-) Transcript_9534:88-801(-)
MSAIISSATTLAKYDASPISLHIASFCAANWSSWRIGSNPGVSSKSIPSLGLSIFVPSLTQRSWRVTPTFGALSTARFLVKRFIRALFPTFGYPTITTLGARGSSPLFFLASLTGLLRSIAARSSSSMPFPSLPFVQYGSIPANLKYFVHFSRSALVIASIRLMANNLFLCWVHSPNLGCSVARGQRESRTSITTSTIFSCSFSAFSAFAMCPGNHCTIRAFPKSSIPSSLGLCTAW